MFVPSVCHGQAKCPWIDEATARGILGGAVTAQVNIKDTSYRVCEFSRQDGDVRRQLSVLVIVMTNIPKQFSTYVTQCGDTAVCVCSSVAGLVFIFISSGFVIYGNLALPRQCRLPRDSWPCSF